MFLLGGGDETLQEVLTFSEDKRLAWRFFFCLLIKFLKKSDDLQLLLFCLHWNANLICLKKACDYFRSF